jgi:hypothetical protein
VLSIAKVFPLVYYEIKVDDKWITTILVFAFRRKRKSGRVVDAFNGRVRAILDVVVIADAGQIPRYQTSPVFQGFRGVP